MDAYEEARGYIEGGVLTEKDTLDTVLQLAVDKAAVGAYVAQLKKSVDAVGAAHLGTLQAHMEMTAKRLGTKPVKIELTELEKKAAKIVPKTTAKVMAALPASNSAQALGRRARTSRRWFTDPTVGSWPSITPAMRKRTSRSAPSISCTAISGRTLCW